MLLGDEPHLDVALPKITTFASFQKTQKYSTYSMPLYTIERGRLPKFDAVLDDKSSETLLLH